MNIAYIGRLSLALLAEKIKFQPPLPDVTWGFELGTAFVHGLLARGHRINVVMTSYQVKSMSKHHAENCDVYLLPERKFKLQMLTGYSREIAAISNCIQTIKPDVVFSQWTYQNARAGLLSGYPTLVVAHDSPWRVAWLSKNVASVFKAIYSEIFVFPKLEHVTAVSPHIVEDLKRFNGFRREVPIIPNGVVVNSGHDKREKIIRRAGRTVVCVSQWGRLKNVKALVKAFKILWRRHHDWRLILYGQGLSPDAKRKELACEGVELRGLAGRAEINRALQDEADLFCSPTLEESFGMVFVEAMLQGVPCVGGKKSGAVSWVMGDGGVTCDVSNPNELALCLEHVMMDYELRRQLSANGIKRVRENFDIEHVVDLYEKELELVSAEGRQAQNID